MPTITLDGDSDGVAPATDGSAYANKFGQIHATNHQGRLPQPAAGSSEGVCGPGHEVDEGRLIILPRSRRRVPGEAQNSRRIPPVGVIPTALDIDRRPLPGAD